METPTLFENRAQAGKELAMHLETTYQASNPLVAGVPRGGVEVAFYVAQRLQAELEVIVSKKLPYPGNPEYGFGAVAEDGTVYVDKDRAKGLDRRSIDDIVTRQLAEIKRRVKAYRNGQPLRQMAGRTVMLIDDGIATGATLVPLVALCRKRQAAKVVIAAPVSGSHFDEQLAAADELEILHRPDPFFAVGQAYEHFGDFSDDELLELLSRSVKV